MKSLTLSFTIAFLMSAGLATAQEHFQVAGTTDATHSLLLMECNIDGNLLPRGDEVGAFDPQGVCAGVGLFDNGEDGLTGIALWRDDPDTDFDEGFESGDEYTCRIWDADRGIELAGALEIREGPAVWERDAFTIATLTARGVPRIIAEQREHDFGLLDLLVDEPAVWETEIRNTGNGDLTFGQITAQGDSSAFGLVLSGDVVEPDSSTTLSVTFPTDDVRLGTNYDAVFTISTNGDDIVYHFVGETGMPRFVIDRDTVDMGEACPFDDGYNTPRQTFDSLRVTNPGNALAFLRQVTFDDPAFSTRGDFEDSIFIAPGEEIFIPIVFDPLDDDSGLHHAGYVYLDAISSEPSTFLRVWLYGRSVWGIEVRPEAPLEPSTFSLSAFPNPFNSSTTISFSVGAYCNTPLRLAIYDVNGRLVADLLDGRGVSRNAPTAGEHKIVWDASGVGAGVYFVRLTDGINSSSRKIVVMK